MMRAGPPAAAPSGHDSLLQDLAKAARPTGSSAIASARERCARELRELGFDVHEWDFEFSELPGRYGTPLVGAVAVFIVGIAGRLGVQGARFMPLVTLALGALTLYAAGTWLARRAVLHAPLLRARGVNLEATRGPEPPAVWLCAHLDSKSQPVPTLVRTAGVVLEGSGYVLTLALAVAAAVGWGARMHPFFWAFAAAVTLVGALPVVLSVVGRRSPGALDNAAGVVAMIEVARRMSGRERGDSRVGILITDGEELGLAGARAWAGSRAPAPVLNCDGVDDDGEIQVMHTSRRPTDLLDAVARASASTGIQYRAARLIPGVLTDSVAFSDAGIPSVTFSRGSWRSLARVHSRRDDLSHLRGTGIAAVATLVASTVREIGAVS